MTPTAQKNKALKDKITSERRMSRDLVVWIRDIVANYRIGHQAADPDSKAILDSTLKRDYVKAAKDVTTLDIREYKAGFEVLYNTEPVLNTASKKIALDLSSLFGAHLIEVTPEITKTASKWVQRVSALAVQEQWSQKQADAALFNYLKSQRLVIATTESNWVVEGTRRSAVISIKDPLGNSVEQVARLIEEGEINAARRLSKQVEKLTRLPVSQTQGKLIGSVSDAARGKLTTPLAQGRTVANMRAHAERLEAQSKGWQPIGDSHTREEHLQAGAEYLANPIPVDQPFVVGGQLMQHPGDGSLGAALIMIMRCRCATIYN